MLENAVITRFDQQKPLLVVEPGISIKDQQFIDTLTPLGIGDIQLHGNVLVVGHGCDFPEKTLVSNPQTQYRTVKPDITALIMADINICAHPQRHFDQQIESFHFKDELPSVDLQGVQYCPASFTDILKLIPAGSLDFILFFRISHLYMNWNLKISEATRSLRSGGIFAGSGSLSPEMLRQQQSLQILRSVTLFHDYSGLAYEHQHVGFILEKSVKSNF